MIKVFNSNTILNLTENQAHQAKCIDFTAIKDMSLYTNMDFITAMVIKTDLDIMIGSFIRWGSIIAIDKDFVDLINFISLDYNFGNYWIDTEDYSWLSMDYNSHSQNHSDFHLAVHLDYLIIAQ